MSHTDHLLRQLLEVWEGDSMLIQHLHTHSIALGQQMEQLMSAVSDFAAKVNAYMDRQDTAITDIQGDVKSLNDQIAALLAGGTLSAADMASLDAIATRLSNVADKLDALDALTPPATPTS